MPWVGGETAPTRLLLVLLAQYGSTPKDPAV